MRRDLNDRLAEATLNLTLLLTEARADFEEQERELARKRATIVDAEMALRRATRDASHATRPRHLMARERHGPLRRPADGFAIVPIEGKG